MQITIKPDRSAFKTRSSLVMSKKQPHEDSIKTAKKIIGYKREGDYFIAILEDKP